MITRTRDETVTFLHPFKLSGADEVQPAGRYVVETDEELLQTLSFPAYRRLSTFIRLGGSPNSNELDRVVDIDPAELAGALARDAQAQETVPTLTDHTATVAHERRRSAKACAIEGWKHWLALNATELRWTALVIGGVVLAGLFTGSAGGIPGPR